MDNNNSLTSLSDNGIGNTGSNSYKNYLLGFDSLRNPIYGLMENNFPFCGFDPFGNPIWGYDINRNPILGYDVFNYPINICIMAQNPRIMVHDPYGYAIQIKLPESKNDKSFSEKLQDQNDKKAIEKMTSFDTSVIRVEDDIPYLVIKNNLGREIPKRICEESNFKIKKRLQTNGDNNYIVSYCSSNSSNREFYFTDEEFNNGIAYRKYLRSGGSICINKNKIEIFNTFISYLIKSMDTDIVYGNWCFTDSTWKYDNEINELFIDLSSTSNIIFSLLKILGLIKGRFCIKGIPRINHPFYLISDNIPTDLQIISSLNERSKVFEKNLNEAVNNEGIIYLTDNSFGNTNYKFTGNINLLKRFVQMNDAPLVIILGENPNDVICNECLIIEKAFSTSFNQICFNISNLIQFILDNKDLINSLILNSFGILNEENDSPGKVEICYLEALASIIDACKNYAQGEMPEHEALQRAIDVFAMTLKNQSIDVDSIYRAFLKAKKNKDISFVSMKEIDITNVSEVIFDENFFYFRKETFQGILSKYCSAYVYTIIRKQLLEKGILLSNIYRCKRKVKGVDKEKDYLIIGRSKIEKPGERKLTYGGKNEL